MGFLSSIKKIAGTLTMGVVGGFYDAWKAAGDWVTDLVKPDEPLGGTTVNKASSSASIPVVYGTRRVGGARVGLFSAGDKNKFLHSVLVQSEGPIAGVDEITIKDKPVSDLGDKIRYTLHAGADVQSADLDFVAELDEWTEAHKLQGVAYHAVRYEYDKDKYSGLPNFESVLRGRVLHDPRTNTENYSENFALVVLDYFSSQRYGVGMDSSLIDIESFKQSADIADETYESRTDSGVQVRRFACNTVVDTSKTPLENIKRLVSESRAFLIQTAGQWRYIIQNDAAPDHTITYDDIVGDIARNPNGARDRYNRVTVSYVDPNTQWKENEATYPIDESEYQALLEEDNWEESHADLKVESCTDRYQALDIARQALLESRIGGQIAFDGQPWMIRVRCGDLIVMDAPGMNDGVLWRVSSRTLAADGSISFQCAAYEPSIFPWIDLPDQYEPAGPNVADSSFLPPPAGLSFVPQSWNEQSAGLLTWPQSNSAFVHDYAVDVVRLLDGVQVFQSTVESSPEWVDTFQPVVVLPFLDDGSYSAQVRARNALTRSEPVQALFAIAQPVTDRVSSLVQVGEFDQSLTLTWSPIIANELDRYQVQLFDVANNVTLFVTSVVTEKVTIDYETFRAIGFPRSFEVRVAGVNKAGEVGEYVSLAIAKPAPAAPTITVSAESDALHFTFQRPENARGVGLWLSDVEPIAVNDSTQIYKGEALTATAPNLLSEVVYHFAAASYDSFGFGAFAYDDAQTLLDAVQLALDTLNDRGLSIEHDIDQINIEQQARWLSIDSNQQAFREQMLDSALKAAQFQQEVAARDDEFATIINAVVSIDPETGTISNSAYQYADTRFSEASTLIDGVNATISLQASKLEAADQRLTNAESQLEIQAGSISSRVTHTELNETVAGAIAAIQPAYATNFNVSLDGWSSENGTATHNTGQWVDLTLGDIASAMDYSGADNPVVQLVIARDAGAVWVGKLRWSTGGHGYTSAHEMDIDETPDDGQQYTVTVDMGDSADYSTSQITGLRILLGATAADVYRLHSVQAGKRTAAQAAIEGVQGRVSSAEQEISAINGQLSNYVTTTWYEENGVRISDVQSELNSFDSTHSITATLQQLASDGTIEKANTAQQWISGADATIRQIAQTEADSSATQVRQELNAKTGEITQSITAVNQLKRTALRTALDAAKAAREGEQTNDSVAVVNAKSEATATDLAAQAQRTEQLSVEFNEQQSAYEEQVKVFADDISAQAERTEALQLEFGENKAVVQDTLETLASDVVVQAQRTTTLQSNFSSNKASVGQQIETLTAADQAFAQSLEELESSLGSTSADLQDYKRTAIGYCVDANGNPTSHETAATCSLAGNTWRGNMPISEAIRRGRITVTDPQTGQQYNAQVANILQTAINAEGNATATASLLATVKNQLAGLFINVGNKGSEIIARADRFKILTSGGSKTPFRVSGSKVVMRDVDIENANVSGTLYADSIYGGVNITKAVSVRKTAWVPPKFNYSTGEFVEIERLYLTLNGKRDGYKPFFSLHFAVDSRSSKSSNAGTVTSGLLARVEIYKSGVRIHQQQFGCLANGLAGGITAVGTHDARLTGDIMIVLRGYSHESYCNFFEVRGVIGGYA